MSGTHWLFNGSPHKGPIMRNAFLWHGVIMIPAKHRHRLGNPPWWFFPFKPISPWLGPRQYLLPAEIIDSDVWNISYTKRRNVFWLISVWIVSLVVIIPHHHWFKYRSSYIANVITKYSKRNYLRNSVTSALLTPWMLSCAGHLLNALIGRKYVVLAGHR